MHKIEQAMRKDHKPLVVMVQADTDMVYARTAARHLASMVPLFHAQPQPIIIERVVEAKRSVWKRIRNIVAVTMLLIMCTITGSAIAWLDGNDRLQEAHMIIKEAPIFDRKDFTREKGL